MRMIFLIAASALVATGPAAAQLVLGGQAQADVNANAEVNADAGGLLGGVVGGVTSTLDRTVGAADAAVNGALASELRLATRADLTAGAAVRDSRGARVGTVQAVHGDMALVVQGSKAVHVPLAALYRGAGGLVTSLTAAQLRAGASAHVGAHAHGSARN